jgi:hypothetical protein
VKAKDIQLHYATGGPTLRACIEWNRGSFPLYFRFDGAPAGYLANGGDALVAALLLPAMACGEALEIETGVSPKLLASVGTIGEIYGAWAPSATGATPLPARMPKPNVRAGTCVSREKGTGVGLFFSGGVDSWFSLLKNESLEEGSRPTDLVVVRGFDLGLAPDTDTAFDLALTATRRAAAARGMNVISVETNLREFSESLAPWTLYHGGALASVALALGNGLAKCIIGSSDYYQWLAPWGSHPLLDPLWSSDSTEIIHDGCEVTRSEKLQRVAHDDLALATLRVCWERGDLYNCGECEKCLRTMVVLSHLGVLERSAAFTRPLRVKSLRGANTVGNVEWERDIRPMLQRSNSVHRRDVERVMRWNERRRSVGNLIRRAHRVVGGR